MKKRIELKVGEVTASHMATYSSLIEVVAGALGGKKEGDKGPYTENLSEASPEQFQARMASLLSR